MQPYYEHNGITIYHARCEDVLPGLRGLVIADPPYGKSERTDRLSKGRSHKAASLDFKPVAGDDQPFDPTFLLRFPRLVLWGANWYADRLPPSPSWIIWDKRDGTTPDDNADCELAWTNLGGPARVYRHLWRGMIKASEQTERRQHPTQKPVALLAWTLRQYARPDELIIEPYLGYGPALRAAKNLGYPAVGCDIEERYCELAARRLQQEVLPLEVA